MNFLNFLIDLFDAYQLIPLLNDNTLVTTDERLYKGSYIKSIKSRRNWNGDILYK